MQFQYLFITSLMLRFSSTCHCYTCSLKRLAIDCLADPQFRIGKVRSSLLEGITELTISNAPLFTEVIYGASACFLGSFYLGVTIVI